MGGAQPVADSFQNGQDSELSALEKEPSKWDCTVPWETPSLAAVGLEWTSGMLTELGKSVLCVSHMRMEISSSR